MPLALAAALLDLAYGGGSFRDRGQVVRFSTVDVGPLVLGSGAVAASDPFVEPEPAPFDRPVPAGSFPVTLALARYEDDERVAFARVAFAPEAPARWEPAGVSGTLPGGEPHGYGVDAGTGCFMDPAAGPALAARMAGDEAYGDRLIAEMDASYAPTRSWLTVRPSPDRAETVVMFSSGWGDGTYPSYFGLAADGRVVALVTDFLLPLGEEPDRPRPDRPGRPWWRFWSYW